MFDAYLVGEQSHGTCHHVGRAQDFDQSRVHINVAAERLHGDGSGATRVVQALRGYSDNGVAVADASAGKDAAAQPSETVLLCETIQLLLEVDANFV